MTTRDTAYDYACHGALTDPRDEARQFDTLPISVQDLCSVLHGLIVHADWAERYGLPDGVGRSRETLPVADRLRLIAADGSGPLTQARPLATRTSGTCRDFALMLCGMLRHRAIPARVRCGFSTYFAASGNANPFEDHWVCEYWREGQRRWAIADAQLDDLHRQTLKIDFDSSDVPTGKFLVAGEAWRAWRGGQANPDAFGHGPAKGLWFMRVNLVRDLLALHRQETSAWDDWRSATPESMEIDDQALQLCDRIAAVTASLAATSPLVASLPEISPLLVPPWQR